LRKWSRSSYRRKHTGERPVSPEPDVDIVKDWWIMKKSIILLVAVAFILVAGIFPVVSAGAREVMMKPGMDSEKHEVAIFAGGCFWCMEHPFDELDGVISTTSGYIGGTKENPTYKEVSAGGTGHAEAVKVLYDPKKVSYEKLLEVFWRQINPTTPDRQFVDVGSQYRSGIFYNSEEQRKLAEKSKRVMDESGRFGAPIVTEITAAGTFYPAEDYHQDYYKRNPIRYKYYRFGSGRDQYLKKIWGKGS